MGCSLVVTKSFTGHMPVGPELHTAGHWQTVSTSPARSVGFSQGRIFVERPPCDIKWRPAKGLPAAEEVR